jgi:proteic killer suppression protein
MAIQSFGDQATRTFFFTGVPDRKAGWISILLAVKRKLDMVHYAARLDDLKAPPGNRLEALRGRLAGHHSIRVNDQWRIVFRWTAAGPADVRIVDYH